MKPEPTPFFNKMTLTFQEVKSKEGVTILGMFGTIETKKSLKARKVDRKHFIQNLDEIPQLKKYIMNLVDEAIELKETK